MSCHKAIMPWQWVNSQKSLKLTFNELTVWYINLLLIFIEEILSRCIYIETEPKNLSNYSYINFLNSLPDKV